MVKGNIANIGISLDMFEFLSFGLIFPLKKKLGFWVFLVHPTVVSVLLSASVERFFVSRMRDFFVTKWWSYTVEGLLSTGLTPTSFNTDSLKLIVN